MNDLPDDQMRREYADAVRRLVALPHPDAIPPSWRPWSRDHDPDRRLTLTDVVDLLCRHIDHNTVGAPADDGNELLVRHKDSGEVERVHLL